MKICLLKIEGMTEAILGLSLSWNVEIEKAQRAGTRIFDERNKALLGGEAKFLEFVKVWLDITAPRYWWQQFDTYRIGISKQSESTMHTIRRRQLTPEDFENGIIHKKTLAAVNSLIKERDFDGIKSNLPEGFLQRRIIASDVKTLNYIQMQRRSHKLKEWQLFCDFVENTINNKVKFELENYI